MLTVAQPAPAPTQTEFQILHIDTALPIEQQLRIHRINALGSLYYFIKIVLGRRRLTDSLHLPLCRSLERFFIKDLYELPRDHFKSTICSEGRPLWRALPFTAQDEDDFYKLGYSDEFVARMRRLHNPFIKMLLVSANITNAAKLGYRIKRHVESNSVYRTLFPETLPTSQETWTNFSLHMNRPKGADPHGEGTFDFLGVGGALQSRHYHEITEDDLVGAKAIESQSIMDKCIEFHQMVSGAFDTEDKDHDNPQLVVGNRWGYHDLNSHIREHESWFDIHSHGALGGCCEAHPEGVPIFPEEFSEAKLAQRRKQWGAYKFSCQWLNNPCAPEDADFQEAWLRYYEKKETFLEGRPLETRIVHSVYENEKPLSDLRLERLQLAMATDPNHSGATGKCRHSIVVVGLSQIGNYYLLETFAKACSPEVYINKLYEIADRWQMTKLGIETVAAQKYLAYHIDYLNRVKGRRLKLIELKGEVESPDGTITRNKEWRIRNVLSPIFERGQFWVSKNSEEFRSEYITFPKGRFCDILDALAYIPQILRQTSQMFKRTEWLYQNKRMANEINQPYVTRIQ